MERVGGGRGRGTHSSRRQTQGGPLHPIPRSLFLLLLYFISKTKQKRGGGRGVTEGWFENRTKLTKYERQNHKRSQKWISDRSMTYPTRPVCCWNFDSSSPPHPPPHRSQISPFCNNSKRFHFIHFHDPRERKQKVKVQVATWIFFFFIFEFPHKFALISGLRPPSKYFTGTLPVRQ